MALGFKINREDLPARFINGKSTFLKWPMIFTLSTAFRKQFSCFLSFGMTLRVVCPSMLQEWKMSESSYFKRLQHYKTKNSDFFGISTSYSEKFVNFQGKQVTLKVPLKHCTNFNLHCFTLFRLDAVNHSTLIFLPCKKTLQGK